VLGAGERADDAPVGRLSVVADEVLVDRPAERDVEQLHSAADAEERHAPLQGAARERQLELVALRIGGLGVLRAGVAVAPRVEVGPADRHQPVDAVEQHLGRTRVHRQQHRHRAARLHRRHVGVGGQMRRLVPESPARALPHGADPDHRFHVACHDLCCASMLKVSRPGHLQ
jgi:hypothetical protein